MSKVYVMPFEEVTDLRLIRPVTGKVLGYGTLRVESVRQNQDLEMLQYLPQPEEIFLVLNDLIFTDRQDHEDGV